MNPLVYIILVNWNGKNDTLECLSSLQKVTYTNFKVLVVDNASGDGSVEAIRKEFSNIELITNKENLRFSGGNNVGIQYALNNNAELVLLLNNDTTVEPNFLSELITISEKNKNVGIVGAKIFYYTNKKRLWYAGGTINFKTGMSKHRGIREVDTKKYDNVEEVDYITGCCMLLKREVVEKVGMLDESYFIYGEDADWCLRAKNAGYKLMYAPSAIVYHKVSVSSGGNFSWFKNWNKLKSNLRLLWRYADWYYWFVIPFTFPAGVLLSYLKAKREAKELSR
mgnify:CR=1 FL=1